MRRRKACPKRAQLEFAVVLDQVRRRKEAFIARLQSLVYADGPCILYKGAKNVNGYGRMNFRFKDHRRRTREASHVQIEAHRLFLILRLGTPIPTDREAGHYFCHNEACVRHVELQTREQNLAIRDAQKIEDDSIPF